MSQLRRAVGFAYRLHRQRTVTTLSGHLRQDPLALLHLSVGRDDPYPLYESLRARGALHRARGGFWVATGYRACQLLSRDPRFGSRTETVRRPLARRGIDMSILDLDPPDHTRLRHLVQPVFSPRAIAQRESLIEQIVGDLLDRAGSDFDLVNDLAAPLPARVIMDVLGVPERYLQHLTRFNEAVRPILNGIRSLRQAFEIRKVYAEVGELFDSLLEQRERTDGIVGRLARIDAGRATPQELRSLCMLLTFTGIETTINLMSNSVLALMRHREQWEALCADPAGLAAKAVQETVRFDPPVQRVSRVAKEDVTIDGQTIGKGQLVLVLLGAAHRDPEQYDRPDEFDIGRDAANLGFGSGIHHCLGRPLALAEGTIALRQLAERHPGLTIAGAVRRSNGAAIRGPLTLPVHIP